ncbi:3307_t:CDS:2 [Funneliformis caledonium]|uniref:3307_t:CDS:1 n=1 Tax=Funneliformis caledonium TaxID=1117310 RepID=A0A9N9BV79_9GLOM|nr:3307_t:CDS:2 [Funneliformis caledonium]
MNMERNPYKRIIREDNPYLMMKREENPYARKVENPYIKKEENPYIRKENPYRQNQVENPYLKKQEDTSYGPRNDVNSYLKKCEEKRVPVVKNEVNHKYRKENPYIKEHLKDQSNAGFDIEIADPILTNPESPSVLKIDRFCLRNVPVHKKNPYANWKFSGIKDIDQNQEAKCIKSSAIVDDQYIRIDAFTVTPKPVIYDYLIELDWKLNEEFIDAVRIEQGVVVEPINVANQGFKDERIKDVVERADRDEVKDDEKVDDNIKSPVDIEVDYSEAMEITTEATTIVESHKPDKSEKDLITTEEMTFVELLKQGKSEKDLITTEATTVDEPIKQTGSEKGLIETDYESLEKIESEKSLIESEATKAVESHKQNESDKDTTETTKIIELYKQNEGNVTAEATKIIELHKQDECKKEIHADASHSPREESVSYPLIASQREVKMEMVVKETTKIAEKVNTNDKVKTLKSQLHLLFNPHLMSESAVSKGNSDQSKIVNQNVLKPDNKISKSSENDVKKEPGKANLIVENPFCGNRIMDQVKADQALQLSPTQDKPEREHPAQLHVKLSQKFTMSQASKPNSVPTFILAGDRFVREDKALIDLDKDDSVETSSINNRKPLQVKLPPELHEIDYTGWIMQQIVEEFQNNLRTNNNQPRVKPSGSFLEEFEG